MLDNLEYLKFRITSPEQSAQLQEVLFDLGYRWWNGPVVTLRGEAYIFTDGLGAISYNMPGGGFAKYDKEEKDTEKFITEHSK